MTPVEARDEMLANFFAAWKELNYPVVWTDVPGDVPNAKTVWARVVIRHANGGQGSLSNEHGKKRWFKDGTIFIQIFSPVGDGSVAGYLAADAVMDAYKTARDCVWYRNIRMQELGSDGAFEQINVLIDFSYDDVK